MLHLIRFIFICAIVWASKYLVLTVDFVEVNIANVSSDFTVTKKKNYDHIVVSEELKTDNKCIGRVVDGTVIISYEPDPKATHRYVRVVKYPKSGDYNPDLDESARHQTLEEEEEPEESSTSYADHDGVKTVEIHTFFDDIVLLDRYFKDQNGQYVNFNFEYVDVDICQEITEKTKIESVDYYRVPNYKTVGAIKCGNTVLLDGLNIFYRTMEIDEKKVVVNTVPKFGLISDVTFDLGKVLKQVTTEWVDKKLLTLKLDTFSPFYEKIVTSCGDKCIFFDGCNEKVILVNVQDNESLIYSNKNTLCLSVKVEDLPEGKYLTIYDKPKNSNYYLVTIMKRGANETTFTNHKKTPVDVDVTAVPSPKDHQYNALLKHETLTPNDRYRIRDIDYRIGNVYMGDNLLLGDADIIFNREIYTNEKGIMVFDQYYNGESNRYLFRPASTGTSGEILNREGNALNLLPEYVLKVDLKNLPTNVTKYFTVSKSNLYVKTSSFVEKLGSLTYNNFMVCPNRFYVSNQYLIMDDKEMKLYSLTRRGYSFLESFVKVDSFVDGESTFVSKAKEMVKFDIMDFYNRLNNLALDLMTDFDHTYLGDYYLVGIKYKYLFGKMLGNIECNGKVISPLDTDLSSRQLLLPTNSQSFFIIKDCDTMDCWHRTYMQTSSNGQIGYEIQQKTSIPLDLLKIYKHDQGQTVFTFEYFVVYKYGTVYNVRVLNDLEHKIGKIMYNNTDLLPDNEHVFTRMVNVSVTTQNNADFIGSSIINNISTTPIKGNLRILEIEKWEKTTKLFTYEIDATQFKATGVAKKSLELDLEPIVRKDPNLSISERDQSLNYQINWNNRDDYELTKIKCSYLSGGQWASSYVIDNLKGFPVFVRLYRDDDYINSKRISLAVENHHGLEKPKSGQLFTLEKNEAKKGFLLKYSLTDKTASYMTDHVKDSFNRRNFTAHRHVFHVDDPQPGTGMQVTQTAAPSSTTAGQVPQAVPQAQAAPVVQPIQNTRGTSPANQSQGVAQTATVAQPGQATTGALPTQSQTATATGPAATPQTGSASGKIGKTFHIDDD